MLELFGADYVIDHVLIEIKRLNEEKSYKIYISDALHAVVNNSAQVAAEQRSYISIKKRWIDVITPQKHSQKVDDSRSCKEIVSDMWKRIRKKGGNDNGLNGIGSKIDP